MHIVVTPRLTLRPPLEVDVDAIFSGIASGEVRRMLSGPPHPYRREHAASFVQECMRDREADHFTVHRDRLVGIVGVRRRKADGQPDLGYWLAQSAWSQGIATEAAMAVLRHVFATRGHERIVSGALSDNPASLRVLSRLGFEDEGERVPEFVAARGCEVEATRVTLTRERFHALHGRADECIAA